jgi:ribosome-associated translation inhibitor RaiA
MRVSLSFHGTSPVSRAGLRDRFHDRARLIERRLASFQPDALWIEGRIDKNPAHHLYRASVRLKVPGRVLAASAEDHDLSTVLVAVFDDLERRTEKYLGRLRETRQRRQAPAHRRVDSRERPHVPFI